MFLLLRSLLFEFFLLEDRRINLILSYAVHFLTGLESTEEDAGSESDGPTDSCHTIEDLLGQAWLATHGFLWAFAGIFFIAHSEIFYWVIICATAGPWNFPGPGAFFPGGGSSVFFSFFGAGEVAQLCKHIAKTNARQVE